MMLDHSNTPPPTESTANAAATTTTSNKWGPYSGAGDFGANMAIVVAALLGTVFLAFVLGAAIRVFCRRHRRGRHQSTEKPEKLAAVVAAMPTMVFSAAGTKLAGGGAECSICLTEFAEGDAVRVLPACSHGFHVRCIEQWLAARSSCPTCRARCHTDASPEKQNQAAQVAVEAA